MSNRIAASKEPFINQTGYYATTGTFFGVAIIAAAARAFIRIHHLKQVNVEDYLVFVAVAAHVAATGLRFSWIEPAYEAIPISEGKIIPPPDFMQKIQVIAQYALTTQFLYWTTIYFVKWSFLFYFKTLTHRLKRMEVWWWFTLVVFVPVTVIAITTPFIVCPHTGRSILLHCQSTPAFVRREHIFLYFTAASDLVTDVMLISIPVIILRKSSFDLRRKISIGAVLCLSLFMIAISLIRVISAGVKGSEDQMWNSFWVQIEASVSVIAVCPTAFRSLLLIKNSPQYRPDKDHLNQKRIWRRKEPILASVDVRATLTGIRTLIRDNGQEQLELQDDGGVLSSIEMQDTHSSQSLEATTRTHEAAGAIA